MRKRTEIELGDSLPHLHSYCATAFVNNHYSVNIYRQTCKASPLTDRLTVKTLGHHLNNNYFLKSKKNNLLYGLNGRRF